MPTRNLPLNTWVVVDRHSPGKHLAFVSKHVSQHDAEVERDRRNKLSMSLTMAFAWFWSLSRSGWADNGRQPQGYQPASDRAPVRGVADFNGDGKFETDEMGVWLTKRVPELTGQKQHPLRHQSAPVYYTMDNH